MLSKSHPAIHDAQMRFKEMDPAADHSIFLHRRDCNTVIC